MERGSCTASRYVPDQERTYHLSLLIGQDVSAWAAHDLSNGAVMALGWGKGDQPLGDDLLPAGIPLGSKLAQSHGLHFSPLPSGQLHHGAIGAHQHLLRLGSRHGPPRFQLHYLGLDYGLGRPPVPQRYLLYAGRTYFHLPQSGQLLLRLSIGHSAAQSGDGFLHLRRVRPRQ